MKTEREMFEDWYVTHAFDYETNPLGSRECGLQWEAWLARAKAPVQHDQPSYVRDYHDAMRKPMEGKP